MSLKPLKRLLGGGSLDEAPAEMVIDGRLIPVSYRRNAKARRIIMRIDKRGLPLHRLDGYGSGWNRLSRLKQKLWKAPR